MHIASVRNTALVLVLTLSITILTTISAAQMPPSGMDSGDRAEMPEEMPDRMPDDIQPGQMALDARTLSAQQFGPAVSDRVASEDVIAQMMAAYVEEEYGIDARPEDHVELCPDAEAVADAVWQQLQDQDIVEDRPFCETWEARADTCLEGGETACNRILEEPADSQAEAMGMTCPPDHEQMEAFCVRQFKDDMNAHQQEAKQETCAERWDGHQEICAGMEEQRELRDEFADRERPNASDYRDEYGGEYEDEFEDRNDSDDEWNDSDSFEDRRDEFEEMLNETRAERRLDGTLVRVAEHGNDTDSDSDTDSTVVTEDDDDGMSREEFMDEIPPCEKDAFMAQCRAQMDDRFAQMENEMRQECEQQADRMLQDARQMCDEREQTHQTCMEHREKACSFATDAAETCNSISEDELYQVLVDRAEHLCNVTERRVEDSVLNELENVSDTLQTELQVAIDNDQQNYVEALEQMEQVEERENSRGMGYSVQRALGLAAEEEQRDAEELRESADKIDEAISSLEDIAEQTSNTAVRQKIQEQITKLEERRDDLRERADEKEERASGILGVFG